MDAKLKDLRGQLKDLHSQFDKSENDLKVGAIIFYQKMYFSLELPVL